MEYYIFPTIAVPRTTHIATKYGFHLRALSNFPDETVLQEAAVEWDRNNLAFANQYSCLVLTDAAKAAQGSVARDGGARQLSDPQKAALLLELCMWPFTRHDPVRGSTSLSFARLAILPANENRALWPEYQVDNQFLRAGEVATMLRRAACVKATLYSDPDKWDLNCERLTWAGRFDKWQWHDHFAFLLWQLHCWEWPPFWNAALAMRSALFAKYGDRLDASVALATASIESLLPISGDEKVTGQFKALALMLLGIFEPNQKCKIHLKLLDRLYLFRSKYFHTGQAPSDKPEQHPGPSLLQYAQCLFLSLALQLHKLDQYGQRKNKDLDGEEHADWIKAVRIYQARLDKLAEHKNRVQALRLLDQRIDSREIEDLAFDVNDPSASDAMLVCVGIAVLRRLIVALPAEQRVGWAKSCMANIPEGAVGLLRLLDALDAQELVKFGDIDSAIYKFSINAAPRTVLEDDLVIRVLAIDKQLAGIAAIFATWSSQQKGVFNFDVCSGFSLEQFGQLSRLIEYSVFEFLVAVLSGNVPDGCGALDDIAMSWVHVLRDALARAVSRQSAGGTASAST